MFERNLLEVLRITFLLQTFSHISLCLQVYIEIVGLLLAAVSVNGLNSVMCRVMMRARNLPYKSPTRVTPRR